jgi:hypothetical protein
MTASTSASTRLRPGSTATPSKAPTTIVNGRPIPSSRTGTAYSARNLRSEIRDASAKRTRTSVISASSFTSSLSTLSSTSPSTGPTSSSAAVKNIATEMLRRSSRPASAANASSRNAIVANAHVICR